MFRLSFTPTDFHTGYLHICVQGKELTEYTKDGKLYYGKCCYDSFSQWLSKSLPYILAHDPYPIPIWGETAAEWRRNTLLRFRKTAPELTQKEKLLVHEWSCRHWADSCADERMIPSVCFRSVNGYIEISWGIFNNHYGDIRFTHEEGLAYISHECFQKEAERFIDSYKTP